MELSRTQPDISRTPRHEQGQDVNPWAQRGSGLNTLCHMDKLDCGDEKGCSLWQELYKEGFQLSWMGVW